MADQITLDYIEASKNRLLDELRRQQGVVHDKVRAVALGYATGLYLYGAPGTAKTYNVKAVLEWQVKEPYTYQRGHLTPMGLFELLAEHPGSLLLLDDLGAILRSEVALQVLLAALEHPTGRDRGRVVIYRRQGREMRTCFHGGIICISNKELHADELLSAFKSRVHTLNYSPSDAQLGAQMLNIAGRGWSSSGIIQEVKPEEAVEVARFVIQESLRLGCRFDLRLLVDKALPDFLQWKDGETESHWRDLVTASIKEQLVAVCHPSEAEPSRAGRKEDEHLIVQEILRAHNTRQGRVEAWNERTGKSERAFYRRLAEMR